MIFVLGEEKPRDNLEVNRHWLYECVLIHLSLSRVLLHGPRSVALGWVSTWTGGRFGSLAQSAGRGENAWAWPYDAVWVQQCRNKDDKTTESCRGNKHNKHAKAQNPQPQQKNNFLLC